MTEEKDITRKVSDPAIPSKLSEKRVIKNDIFNGIANERLIPAAEYQKMIMAGILHEDERIELLEGRIVEMSPKNVAHATATENANELFHRLLQSRARIRVQHPILLDDYSEPEPDIVLIDPNYSKHRQTHHPKPNEIFLILEIAESSIRYDRDVKCPVYAQNGIVQYCLLNLKTRELEDYRNPSGTEYKTKITYSEEQNFSLVAFPEVTISVKELLPPTD